MATSEHPETPSSTTGIQKSSGIQTPGEASTVPLPPLPQKPAIEAASFLRLRGWFDALLVAVVLLFAFLAASFPAENADFFRQAAIGRLISQGQYHFGVDPFVYNADNDYFVNHSWLFALLMYGLYQLPGIGGAAVVIFKALVIVLLAEILLRTGRRVGQSLWIPAVCTALAILVASPRLFLQPTCLTFLFLGVTFFIVSQGEKRSWWLLPPLFALWINCDSWFFLGPLTVALYLAGGLISRSVSRDPEGSAGSALPSGSRLTEPQGQLRTLGLVLAVGVAAWLINPHHIHALTLPPEFGLTPTGSLIERDPQFYPLFLSPLGKDYYRPIVGLNPAGLAYWPLLALGLISFGFLFAIGQARWPRLLVWSGFALMSLYNMRAIPLFAIVAGPIASLNWLDFAALRLGVAPRLTRGWRNGSLAGRALTLLLGVVLLLATAPGWLQRGFPHFHRIGWSVQVDPSLQAMAEAVHKWDEAGLLPDQPHWFNMDREIADYVAWFAPGQRVFFDYNLPYYREAALDYLDFRKGLEQLVSEKPDDKEDAIALKTDWRKILRKNKVRFWIFDNRSVHKTNSIAQLMLFGGPEEWMLCHLQGRIAVFAWLNSQQPPPAPSPRLKLDLKSAAFGPNAEPAPPVGVEPAQPGEWWQTCWDAWRQPNPPPSSDSEAIGLYDFRFVWVERPRQIHHYSQLFRGAMAAGAIANSLPHGPIPNNLLALSWSCTYHDLLPPGAVRPLRQPHDYEEPAFNNWDRFVRSHFIEPPSLYLAVRAGRRALQSDPENALAYLALGQVYQHLHELPHEQDFRGSAPQLSAIRRSQIAAALLNCLRLQPDDRHAAQAHEALYLLYQERNSSYIDAAVEQLRQAIDKRKAAGPSLGESSTHFNQILDRMQAALTRQEGELTRISNRYEVHANTAKTEWEKIRIALEHRLAYKATSVLEQNPDNKPGNLFESDIVKKATEVYLDLGQLDKAQELLPRLERPVNPRDVDRYVRLAAARGDYAEADRLLDEALRHTWKPAPGEPILLEPAAHVARLVAKVLLVNGQRHMDARLLGAPCMPWPTNNLADALNFPWLVENSSDFWVRRWQLAAIEIGMIAAQQQAEWTLKRGWLALEAGHCDEARTHFRSVRDIVVPAWNWVPQVNRLNTYLLGPDMLRLQQLGFQQDILPHLSTRYLKWFEEKPIPEAMLGD